MLEKLFKIIVPWLFFKYELDIKALIATLEYFYIFAFISKFKHKYCKSIISFD